MRNPRRFLLDKELILKTDPDTAWKPFLYYSLADEVDEFKNYVTSQYVRNVIENVDLHKKISEGLKELSYSNFFSEDDTQWIIELFFRNLKSSDFSDEWVKEGRLDVVSSLIIRFIPRLQNILDVFLHFDLTHFNSEEELIKTLAIRDKILAFVEKNFEKVAKKIDTIQKTAANWNEDEEKFIDVYKKTGMYLLSEHMLRQTERIKNKAKEHNIEFKEEYNSPGSMLKSSISN